MKQYRLLKDLPGVKAGAISKGINPYVFGGEPTGYGLNEKTIQNNPDWFEEVKPFEWTDELVKEAIQFYVAHEKDKYLVDIIEEFKQQKAQHNADLA